MSRVKIDVHGMFIQCGVTDGTGEALDATFRVLTAINMPIAIGVLDLTRLLVVVDIQLHTAQFLSDLLTIAPKLVVGAIPPARADLKDLLVIVL